MSMALSREILERPYAQSVKPPKICSLIPSGTEIAFALGLGDHVVGVTSFCNYPPEAKNRCIVSRGVIKDLYNRREADVDAEVQMFAREGRSAYTLDVNWLNTVKPDLILTQDMCNSCDARANDVICSIKDYQATILVLNAHFIDDIFRNIRRLAEAAGIQDKGEYLIRNLKERIQRIQCLVSHAFYKPRIVFLEWLDPPSPAGDWFPEMVELAGGIPLLSQKGQPPVKMSWEDISCCEPDCIIISPCSHPIKRSLNELPDIAKNERWWKIKAVREGNVYVIDSEFYERPGPRIIDGVEILAQIFHPSIIGNRIPPNIVVKLRPPWTGTHPLRNIINAFEPYPKLSRIPSTSSFFAT